MQQEALVLIQVKCFKLSGFRELKKYRTLIILSISGLVYCMFSECLFIVRHIDNILAVAEAFGPVGTAATALIKILSFSFSSELFLA